MMRTQGNLTIVMNKYSKINAIDVKAIFNFEIGYGRNISFGHNHNGKHFQDKRVCHDDTIIDYILNKYAGLTHLLIEGVIVETEETTNSETKILNFKPLIIGGNDNEDL